MSEECAENDDRVHTSHKLKGFNFHLFSRFVYVVQTIGEMC